MRYLVLIVCTIVITSCSSQKQLQKIPLVYYGKTACLGKCPVFDLYIFSDGSVTYEGLQNVSKKGKHQYKISSKEVQKIKDVLSKMSEREVSEKKLIRDLPNIIIKHKEKRIVLQSKEEFGEIIKLLEKVIHNK